MRSVQTLLQSNHNSFTKLEWQLLGAHGIVNGYGPRNSRVLHWMIARIFPAFRDAKADRKRADEGFFIRIIRDYLKTWRESVYYIPLSVIFFLAVRIFGSKYFNYEQCQKR